MPLIHPTSYLLPETYAFANCRSLAELEKELDPALFFRLNRKYIANINAIDKLKSQGKGKLMVELSPPPPEEVLVSSEQTASFKEWMDA